VRLRRLRCAAGYKQSQLSRLSRGYTVSAPSLCILTAKQAKQGGLVNNTNSCASVGGYTICTSQLCILFQLTGQSNE